jgi:hypothetical protein
MTANTAQRHMNSPSPPPFDGKRHPRHKEGQFVYKYGKRHHSYDREKAPYPLSYDKEVLEM